MPEAIFKPILLLGMWHSGSPVLFIFCPYQNDEFSAYSLYAETIDEAMEALLEIRMNPEALKDLNVSRCGRVFAMSCQSGPFRTETAAKMVLFFLLCHCHWY